MKKISFLLALLFTSGCSVFPSTEFRVNSGQERPSFEGTVLTYRHNVPSNVEYSVIGNFVEQGQWYGSTDETEHVAARSAAGKGANGILIQDSGHRITGWSWSSPYTEGKLLWIQNYDTAAQTQ
ncbi:MAG: hypothetical protein HRU00_13980 [Myxococcales bacterium]|nr:hypothetical protein [Myxococcales bacterium]